VTPAAKYAPAILPLASTSFVAHSEVIIQVGAIVVGLALGAMWRAGSLRGDGKNWSEVRADLGVSALIGGANAVLAVALVDWLNVGVPAAMAVGVVVGATGLRALPEIRDAFFAVLRRKLIGEDTVTLTAPKDIEMRALRKQLDNPDQQPSPPSVPPE